METLNFAKLRKNIFKESYNKEMQIFEIDYYIKLKLFKL